MMWASSATLDVAAGGFSSIGGRLMRPTCLARRGTKLHAPYIVNAIRTQRRMRLSWDDRVEERVSAVRGLKCGGRGSLMSIVAISPIRLTRTRVSAQ